MAHKYYISSDISLDEKLNELGEQNPLYTLIWPWLIMAFDDWGRADASPRRLKAQLFPLLDAITIQVIKDALAAYVASGFIVAYEVEGKPYIAVPRDKWFRYQTHIHVSKRENDESSRIPAPPETPSPPAPRTSAQSRAKSRSVAENCASPSPSLPPTPSLSLSPSAGARAPTRDGEEREDSLPVGKDEDATAPPKPASLEDKLRRNGIRGALTDLWGRPDKAEQDEWEDGVDKIFADGYTGDDVKRAIPLFEQRRSKTPHKPYLLAKNMRSLLSEGSPRASPDVMPMPAKPRASFYPTEEEIAESERALKDIFSQTS